MGKPSVAEAGSRPLVFALNGKRVELANVDPATTLLYYIRTHTPSAAPSADVGKVEITDPRRRTLALFWNSQCMLCVVHANCGLWVNCGCGACVVLLSRYNSSTKQVEELTINSCLTLLCSIDGCAITTTEGLGSLRDGHHAIHKRLSGFHASQCGFCTPGMTMAIYGCLRNQQAKNSSCISGPTKESSQSNGTGLCNKAYAVPGLTVEKAEKSVSGNLCRCTGYRPILDACKSFACDVDLEDLGLNSFQANNLSGGPGQLPQYDPSADPIFPKFLLEDLEAKAIPRKQDDEPHDQLRFRHVDTSPDEGEKDRLWVSPRNLAEVFSSLKLYQGKRNVRLVVGNTSSGIFKDIKPEVFIDISKVPELLSVHQGSHGIEVGAAVSIAKLIDLLEDFAPLSPISGVNQTQENGKANGGTLSYGENVSNSIRLALATHLKQLATGHVRNWGSVGGNLVMAQQYSFDSDLATILLGAGVKVKIVSEGKTHPIIESLNLDEFLAKGLLDDGSLLQSIWIPLEDEGPVSNGHFVINGSVNGNGKVSDASSDSKVVFKTFRASPRPMGNAVSYVNAAFFARVSDNGAGNVIQKVRLAYGAFGTKHAIRALKVEELITSKVLTPSLLLEAVSLLKKDVVPRVGTTKAEFRVSSAVGFLFEFLNPLLPVNTSPTRQPTMARHSGRQIITVTDEHFPVNQPAPKVFAELQASGEAIYVDDIPSPENCLHAAFVYSEEPLAKVKGVTANSALGSVGAVAYVSASDIPPGGKNVGLAHAFSTETLFATDLVECVGQLLGVVVADTYDHARTAAAKVSIDYDTHSVGPAVLSVEDAVSQKSLFDPHWYVAPELHPVGDVAKGLAEADFKIEGAEVSTPSQNHFYMETQTALVVPDEDGCFVVYCCTQVPETVQETVAACLGLPVHNVRVITRRLGGAFGGKAFRNMPITVACALAAYKLNRPVRFSLDRNTDMILIGGRSPTKTTFTVGFTADGKVTALKAHVLIEAGWSPDISILIPGSISGAIKKYNWGASDVTIQVCKTNSIPKTSMRAPGDVQGSFIADAIIEHVAAALGMDAHKVREKNFHDASSIEKFCGADKVGGAEGYTLALMWEKLKASANWEFKEKEVQAFNSHSKWAKRGLAMIPCIYALGASPSVATVSIFQDGSIVAEVGGVEMGQGLYTKVKQTIAFGLSKLWPQGRGVDMSKVRIVQADSISLPHGGITGGSTKSEGSCAAVLEACAVLVERLLPIKQNLEKDLPSYSLPWEALAGAGKFMTDLTAHVRWSPTQMQYLNYGVCLSQVEINVLTGETRTLSTDLIYDCGKSLNPAVDLGQVEGAFVQGMGFFLTEEIVRDNKGKLVSDGTWTYKVPSMDVIPHNFNVELYNSPAHKDRVLSSKASGEPPLLLAGSILSAIRYAIQAARREFPSATRNPGANGSLTKGADIFRLDPPATIDKVKTLCGLDIVEQYLASLVEMEHK